MMFSKVELNTVLILISWLLDPHCCQNQCSACHGIGLNFGQFLNSPEMILKYPTGKWVEEWNIGKPWLNG